MKAWFFCLDEPGTMFSSPRCCCFHCTLVHNLLPPHFWAYSGLQIPSVVSPWGAVDQVSAFFLSSLSPYLMFLFRKLKLLFGPSLLQNPSHTIYFKVCHLGIYGHHDDVLGSPHPWGAVDQEAEVPTHPHQCHRTSLIYRTSVHWPVYQPAACLWPSRTVHLYTDQPTSQPPVCGLPGPIKERCTGDSSNLGLSATLLRCRAFRLVFLIIDYLWLHISIIILINKRIRPKDPTNVFSFFV